MHPVYRALSIAAAFILLTGLALAQPTPSHPLSHISPTDTDLDFSNNPSGIGYNITGLPAINPAGSQLMLLGDLDLQGNSITNYFGSDCSPTQAVRGINDDGTYTCGSALGGGLPDVLQVNNSAGQYSLNMNGNNISNLPDPITSGQPVTLGFSNTEYVARSGDTMTGDLDLLANDLVNVNTVGNGSSPLGISSTLDLQNNNIQGINQITGYYGSACPAGQALVDVNNDGSFVCVDVAGAADVFVNESGDTMSGTLDMNGNNISNLPNPIASGQPVTQGFAGNTYVNRDGDTMTGDLDLTGNDLLNIDSIGNGSNPVSVTSALALGGNNLQNPGSITSFFDATPCSGDSVIQDVADDGTFTCIDISEQVDTNTIQDIWVNESGDTMTGALNMNGNNISNLPEPLDPANPATKNYVDAQVVAASSDDQSLSEVLVYGNVANTTINMDGNDLTNVGAGNINISASDGDIQLNSNRIEELQAHDSGDDAMRRDDILSEFVDAAGDSMSGNLDMQGNELRNVDALGNGTIRTIQFTPGGNVEIPNGDLDVEGNTILFTGGVTIGSGSSASSSTSVAIGPSSSVSDFGVAVGDSATTGGSTAVAVGQGADASNTNTVAIGPSAFASQSSATVVGSQADATTRGVAVGHSASAGSSDSIAIGDSSTASANGAVAIGNGVTASTSNRITLGTSNGVEIPNGNLVMGGNNIQNPGSITSYFGSACGAGQAAVDVNDDGSFVCVDVAGAADVYVNESGDTMSGALNMNGNNVSNLPDPIASGQPVTLGFANNQYVERSGDTMTGNLDMLGNELRNVDAIGNGTTRTIQFTPGGTVEIPNGNLDMQSNNIVLGASGGQGGSIIGEGSDTINYDGVENQWEIKSRNGQNITVGDSGITIDSSGSDVRMPGGDLIVGAADQNNVVNIARYANSGTLDDLGVIRSSTGNTGIGIQYHDGGSYNLGLAVRNSGTVDIPNGNLSLNNNFITGVSTDVATSSSLITVGDADTRYVERSGDSMTGNLDMGGNQINNIGSGSTAFQADGDLDLNGNSVTSTGGEVCIGDQCA